MYVSFSTRLQLVGQYLGVTLTSAMGSLLHSSKGAVGYTAPINVAFLGLLGAATLIAIFYNGDDPRANANANINASAANAGSINANNEEHDEENPE